MGLLVNMRDFLTKFNLTALSFPSIRISDVIDVLIVAFLIYNIIIWIKETRAWSLFKGIIIIFVFSALAVVLKLTTILWILSKTINVGIIAIMIIFQPELRRALEQLGRGKFFAYFLPSGEEKENIKFSSKTLDEILKATFKMAEVRTGALIVIEQEVPLGDHERTGIPIDAIVTNQLLINIFENKTPLHDGAVLIRRNRVAAATCFLPLTEVELGKELGTRHRAAVGLSEVSDAIVIVASEETGAVSLAQNGKIYRNLDADKIKQMLSFASVEKKKRTLWRGKIKNENSK